MTRMKYGSITPVGLPKDWLILADEAIFQQERITVGSSKVNGKLMFPSALLKEPPNVVIVEGLAKD